MQTIKIGFITYTLVRMLTNREKLLTLNGAFYIATPYNGIRKVSAEDARAAVEHARKAEETAKQNESREQAQLAAAAALAAELAH